VSQGLDPQTVRGLAFVRFMYNRGLEETGRPQPLAIAALLSFHDAAEMFLGLAADHLGVNLTANVNFEGYFNEIKQGANLELPGKHPMRRMNRSRVGLKHHGLFPSPTELGQFKGDVTTFLTDAIMLVFKVDFLSLDMIDLCPSRMRLACCAAPRHRPTRAITPRRSRCCPGRSNSCSSQAARLAVASPFLYLEGYSALSSVTSNLS
jgi:hypothetical protein